MECCIDGRTFQKDNHLHRGTLELCQVDHRVPGLLHAPGPSRPRAPCVRAASTRKSVGGSARQGVKNDGGPWVLGHLPDQGPFPRLLSLARQPALGRALVVPNFFHLRMMKVTVFLGTFNAAEMFGYPSPDLFLVTILSLSCTDKSFNPMA